MDVDLAGPGAPISLSSYSESKPWNPDQAKAESATWVARMIVGVFAATIVLVLIVVVVISISTSTIDLAKRFAETLTTTLDSLGKFLTAVFGPLLAFILGYYFSEKQKTTDRPASP